MSFLQALTYFVVEALAGLRRGWKASLLATITIAVSLSVWGGSMVIGKNVAAAMTRWREEARLIVYISPEASAGDVEGLESLLAQAPWVETVEHVSVELAEERFRRAFPSLSDLMGGWNESSLPPSLEVSMATGAHPKADVESWVDALRSRPGVEMVDDDRDWIAQLEAMAVLARTVGLVVGLVLLGAATFTIASVVRLTAYLYQDEISIMRMVGATEFLIRGPFYAEGLLQGLFGSLLASGGLLAGHTALRGAAVAESLLGELLLREFLSGPQLALLVAIGCAAGTLGAVLSLKGETLAVAES